MRYAIGDVVIAKNSHKDCGYLRGDTIKVVQTSCFKGDFVGKNLTRPYLNDGRAYLGADYFHGKIIRDSSPVRYKKERQIVKFLGIPLFTIEKVGIDE